MRDSWSLLEPFDVIPLFWVSKDADDARIAPCLLRRVDSPAHKYPLYLSR